MDSMDLCDLREPRNLSHAYIDQGCVTIQVEYMKQVSKYNKLIDQVKTQQATLKGLISDFTVLSLYTLKRNILSPLYKFMGLASRDAIDKIYEHVKILHSKQSSAGKSMVALQRGFIQLSNVTTNNFKKLWHGFKGTQDFIRQRDAQYMNWQTATITKLKQIKQMNSDDVEFIERSLHMFQQLEQQVGDLARLDIELSRWSVSLLQLSKGYLDPFLVPTENLAENLKHLKKVLLRLPGVHSFINDEYHLSWYYRKKCTCMLIYDSEVYVHVDVPITSSDQALHIFKVEIVPVKLHSSSQQPQRGYSLLDTKASYLAVSQNNLWNKEMSDTQFELCMLQDDDTCPYLSVLHDRSDHTCLAAVFYRDEARILSKCKFKYFTEEPQMDIIHIAKQTYLVTNAQSDILVTCATNRYVQKADGFYLLKVNCGCIVRAADMTITTEINHCQTEMIDMEIKHVINFAQILHFDIKKFAPSIDMDSLYDDIPRIPVPDFSLLLQKADISETEKQLGISFEKLVSLVDTNAADLILGDLPQDWESEFSLDWEQIIIFASLGFVHVLTLIALLILGIKVKTLQVAIIVLTSRYGETLHVTKPGPSEIAEETTKEPLIPSADTGENSSDYMIILTILGLVGVYVIIKMFLKGLHVCQKNHQSMENNVHVCQTNLNLTIHTRRAGALIPIVRIYNNMHDLHFQILPKPLTIDLQHHGLFHVKIKITWENNLIIFHGLQQNSYRIQLPRVILLKFWQTHSLKAILALASKEPYQVSWTANMPCRCDAGMLTLTEQRCDCLNKFYSATDNSTQTVLYKLPDATHPVTRSPSVWLLGDDSQLEVVT